MIRSSQLLSLLLLFSLSLFLGACSTTKKTTTRRPPTHAPAAGSAERQFRQNVVQYALGLQGTRYKYAGTSPRTGFDCSGFTSYVLKHFRITVSPASSAQSTEGVPVALNAVQPGDIIVFGRNARDIQHVALVVERSQAGIVVVHSTTSRGVIRENISTSAYWQPLILGARDVIGRR